MKSHTILFFLFFGLIGCGNKSGGSSGPSIINRELASEATPGTYYTVLRPVNFHSNGFIPYGMATFKLKDDLLLVDISLDDDQAVQHRQALHSGTRCPNISDDTNGDGFVDYTEALNVVGPILMPLDADLNSQIAGNEIFQKGPAMTYGKQASLKKINNDLWVEDENPTDQIMKLPVGKGVGFDGRVVMIHGTTSQSYFPLSLASYKNEPGHLSLPIVCGLLKKTE